MSARRRELFEAILAAPKDDDLRLVYADVLAEEGDVEQAEFIQGDIAFVRDPTNAPLYARVEALKTAHGKRFAGEAIASRTTKWRFERGLVYEIHVDPLVLSQHAELLLGSAPVRSIVLNDFAARDRDNDSALKIACEAATALAACPHLSRVTEIDASDGGFGPTGDEEAAALQCLLASPHLTSLESLMVESYGKPGTALAIAAAHARLPALNLLLFASSSGTSVGDEGAIALAESPLCARLEALAIWGGDVGAEGVTALARSLRAIRRFVLGPVWYANNEIGPEGARGLATAGAVGLSNLKYLHLGGGGIQDEGLEALARDATWLANVTQLDLSDNGLTDRGLSALAASPYNTSLEKLRICTGTHGTSYTHPNEYTEAGLRALEALPRLKEVTVGKEDESETTLPIPLTKEDLEELFS